MTLKSGTGKTFVDTNMFILLAMVIIFNTDNVLARMKNKSSFQSIQAKYADLLWRYLKTKMSNKASAYFHKGLMFISTTEEAYQISRNRIGV